MKEKLKEIAYRHFCRHLLEEDCACTPMSIQVVSAAYRAGWEERAAKEDAVLAKAKVFPQERIIIERLRDAFRSLRMEE